MYAIVLLIVVVTFSLVITRIASVMLTGTGMAREAARFQARSALTGVGFTTAEAEGVVRHPVRRRIIMAVMLIGNAGLVTAIAALLGGFLGVGGQEQAIRALLLVAALLALYAGSRSPWLDRRLTTLIERFLSRFTDLDVRDYARLLRVTGDYAVREHAVEEGDWITDTPLGDLRLRDEGMVVIGVLRRDGRYVGVPTRDTVLEAGDTALIYGHDEAVRTLSSRTRGTAGDDEHAGGVAASQARNERDEHPRSAGQGQFPERLALARQNKLAHPRTAHRQSPAAHVTLRVSGAHRNRKSAESGFPQPSNSAR